MTTEPTSESTELPKIQVDSDWKAEAQAEKERLAAAEQKVEEKSKQQQMPEPNFRGLMGILASQALMGLGLHQDPSGKGVMVDLDGSKFVIDLLSMIEEKTKGNLTDEESTEIKQLTKELQARFVQVAQLVATQQEDASTVKVTETDTSKIIDPTA